MEINQVLAQMRILEAQAQRGVAVENTAETGKPDFSNLLKQSVEQVNETQMAAKALSTAFEAGDPNVELPEVMVALQKANVSFQAITQVRNKLLSAYQEIMNMQV